MLDSLIPFTFNGVIFMLRVKRITKKFVVFEYEGDEIIAPSLWGA